MQQNQPPSNWVFITVIVFTILSGTLAYYLAAQPQSSLEQTQIFNTCNTIWKAGAFTVFGLLASRKLSA